MRGFLFCVASTLAVSLAACSSGDSGDNSQASQVVQAINTFRTTGHHSTLTEWTAKESCATSEIKADVAADSFYKSFPACGENGEVECGLFPSQAAIVTQCIPMILAKVPPEDGERVIFASEQFHQVAVGFATDKDGKTWATMIFK